MGSGADARVMCPLRSGAAGPALDLVPSVGTTPMSLMRLARALTPARAVRGYAYLGLEDDTAPHDTIEAMAEANLAELCAATPHGPYLVAGHCLGGTVAHAMAAALEARGERVAAVVVIEAIAPLPLDYAGHSPAQLERARKVRAALAARVSDVSPHLEPGVARRIEAVVRLHLDACVRYRASPLQAPIAVLRTAACGDDIVGEWHRYSSQVVQETVPGDALSMLRPPHVEATARTLGRVLADALEAP